MFIKLHTIALLQEIEQHNDIGKEQLKILPNFLPKMFEPQSLRKQRENRFNQHSVVPLAAPTDFYVLRLELRQFFSFVFGFFTFTIETFSRPYQVAPMIILSYENYEKIRL